MRAKQQWRSTVGSFRSLPLVGGEFHTSQAELGHGGEWWQPERCRLESGSGRHDPLDWTLTIDAKCRGSMDDANQKRFAVEFRQRESSAGGGTNCATCLDLATFSKIHGPSGIRHTPDSRPLHLPRGDLSRTIRLNLDESWMNLLCLSGLSGSPIQERRRRRGVGVIVLQFNSHSLLNTGRSRPDRESSRPASRIVARRKTRSKLRLRPSSCCCRTSCDRSLHECPMKKIGRAARGREICFRPMRNRRVLASRTTFASWHKGVGRTRP